MERSRLISGLPLVAILVPLVTCAANSLIAELALKARDSAPLADVAAPPIARDPLKAQLEVDGKAFEVLVAPADPSDERSFWSAAYRVE